MAFETEDQETQYCFPDINSSCVKGKRSRHEYNIMYVFFSLLSAWTVFLNLLVIISISHFKKLHTPTNMIILSLAVNDLLIGLIIMPLEAIKLIETCWYFGETFCGLFMIIMGLLGSTSLSNLVLIAVDRYVAVCHPLLYPQKITMSKTLVTICLCWLFSSAYCSVFVVSNKYFDSSNRTDVCYGMCTLNLSFTYIIVDLIYSFLLPCVVMITVYLRIFYVAIKQVKVINFLMKGRRESSVKRKSEHKAALTLGIVVTVYLLCFIPYYLLSVMGVSSGTLTYLLWTLYANCVVNPLIYALFYRWFKKSVKHILTFKILEPASSLLDIFTDK
ncbi:trace amine-associated receptor 13c-like [Danio rerio]|uniref:Trace amine-associated receptor 13c-like n=1 Tax=Danio rerio TaxID=7955 RepID=A0A8M9PUF0_DANRE